MKIFVLIFAIVSVVCAEDSGFDDDVPEFKWSGNVKKVVDTADYTEDDVLNITKNIFRGMSMNCGGRIEMPNETFIPSPTRDCDLEILHDLKRRLFTGYITLKDYSYFLRKFFNSPVGKFFLKEMTDKGIRKNVVKRAVKETWFNKSTEADFAFNRLFLEADNVASASRSGLNNWYTFNEDFRNRTNCGIATQGENIPVLVVGRCRTQTYRHTSRFIIPSHPFVDLILYSLCAWSKNDYSYTHRTCAAIIPGSEKTFNIAAVRYMNSNKEGYLESAYPTED